MTRLSGGRSSWLGSKSGAIRFQHLLQTINRTLFPEALFSMCQSKPFSGNAGTPQKSQ